MFLLAGVPPTKKNIRSMLALACLCFSVVAVAIFARGLEGFSVVYALSVHLPFTLFFILGFRRPVTTTLLSLILTYFMGAPRFAFGYLSVYLCKRLGLPLDEMIAMRIGWGITVPLLLWPIYRFLIPPLRGMIRNSSSERPYLLALLGSSYVLCQVIFRFMSRYFWTQLLVLFLFAFLVSLVGYSRKLRELRGSNERMIAYSVQNEALAFYTKSLADYLEDTARLRHDQRHFLTLLSLHADRGDLPEIRRLIGDNLATLGSSPERVTGSGVVDAILVLFRKKAGELGLPIEISGKGLSSLPLPENDLCLLLSNCLDNAIEGARLAEGGNRSIAVSVSRNAETGAVSLVVRNPSPAAVAFAEDGIPLSAKGPGHGYGTSSMRTIVTKHGGVCGFSVEDGEFFFRATFLPRRSSLAAEPSHAEPRTNAPNAEPPAPSASRPEAG